MTRDDDKERRWGHLVVWGPFTAVTDADLRRIEEVIGLPLPADYRDFLAAVHGGTLQYAVRLPPHDPGGHLVEFSQLFAAKGDGAGTLVGEWRSHPSTYLAELLPAPILPVARDGGGSMLFLDLREESHGAVWAFVHGLPAWAGGVNQDRGGVVAPSWTEYLDMLVIDEQMAEEIWTDARERAEPGWLPSVVHWLDAGIPAWRAEPWATGAPPRDVT